jgi:hypothetical protein
MRTKTSETRYWRLISQSPTGSRLFAVPDRELQLVLIGQRYGCLGALRGRAEELGVGSPCSSGPRDRRGARRSPTVVPGPWCFRASYEGFGARPLEALACGCPVASLDAASLPEVWGDAAPRVKLRSVESIVSAVGRVSADTELRERLREAGLVRARSFTWHGSAKRHRAIYARVAAT